MPANVAMARQLVGMKNHSVDMIHSDTLLLFRVRTLSKAAAYSSRSKRVCSDNVDVREV